MSSTVSEDTDKTEVGGGPLQRRRRVSRVHAELRPFHLALTVHSLTRARYFYGIVLGCSEGRSSVHFVDFDFFGHLLSCHESVSHNAPPSRSEVDGDPVTVPHFGAILSHSDYERVLTRARDAGVLAHGSPRRVHPGKPAEQRVFFAADPSGNILEFKCFDDETKLFD